MFIGCQDNAAISVKDVPALAGTIGDDLRRGLGARWMLSCPVVRRLGSGALTAAALGLLEEGLARLRHCGRVAAED